MDAKWKLWVYLHGHSEKVVHYHIIFLSPKILLIWSYPSKHLVKKKKLNTDFQFLSTDSAVYILYVNTWTYNRDREWGRSISKTNCDILDPDFAFSYSYISYITANMISNKSIFKSLSFHKRQNPLYYVCIFTHFFCHDNKTSKGINLQNDVNYYSCSCKYGV